MNEIKHTGRIKAVNKDDIAVEITVSSACQTCIAKSSCALSELKKKIVSLPRDPKHDYVVGDEVELSLNINQGLYATWLGFGLPLVLLLAVVFILLYCGFNEIISGICGIIILIPYYIVLFFNRRYMENRLGCRFKYIQRNK